MEEEKKVRTAGEAGWHLSRYNLSAKDPETGNTVIANLFKGTCAAYSPIELYLLSVLDSLDEDHPFIERFARRGLIANFDERGGLHKCAGLTAANPQYVYATAHDWDPANPFDTASNPGVLASYLNCADPVPDDECRECVWLPVCGGGCPHYRLLGNRKCLPYRDDPGRYVLAQYARVRKLRRARKEALAEKE